MLIVIEPIHSRTNLVENIQEIKLQPVSSLRSQEPFCNILAISDKTIRCNCPIFAVLQLTLNLVLNCFEYLMNLRLMV